ncbi:MAG: hypothetical protein R6V60_18045 [Desulfobacterales bacterium]
MKGYLRWIFVTAAFGLLMAWNLTEMAAATVVEAGNNIYLIDRTGERWDITQARSIGFDPDGFEFGIGRNAFRPLTDSDWQPDPNGRRPKMPVIGISAGDDSHAYSIEKLRYHETANTMLGASAILVGY